MTVKGSPFIMNDIAQQLEALNFHHKQKYAKLKHELFAKDDVITRLKQDIVDLQDKLKQHEQSVCGWCAGDVLHMAKDMPVSITEGEAEEILGSIEHNFDASLGISWDTIEWAIEDHVSRRDAEITRLKQDIVDLQDKLSEERHMTATLEDELLEITGEI